MQSEDKLASMLISTIPFLFGVAVENALAGPITLLSFIIWVPLAIVHIVASWAFFRTDMPWLSRCVLHMLVYILVGMAFVWLMSSGFNSLKLGIVQLVENGTLTQAGWLHYLPIIAMYGCISLMALLIVIVLRRVLRGPVVG